MRKYLALFVLAINVFTLNAYADSVKVKVEPQEPVVNEHFHVHFEITSEDGTDPIINFNPLGLDVISKNETGITTRTTYINGKLSTERSLTVVYEMTARRPGSAFLRDINVEINGKVIPHKTIRINIVNTPRKAKDILAVAEASKTEVFEGESILVRYYLYNKVPVSSTDIKKFPNLGKFLKRYHQEKMTAERVRYNGEIYTRRVLYTAQLFPKDSGSYQIDPITLSVQYSNRGNNPFNTFGFGSRYGQVRSMTVSSDPIEIKVKQLPIENVPPSFTGLVGKHDFNLEFNRNRFVVNEPIELKLTVSGEGALELFEAPKIFDNNKIEEFEITSDLVVSDDFTATKTFLYTYLGREGVAIKDKKIPLSYFDPDLLEFKTEYLNIDDIVIAGTGAKTGKSAKEDLERPDAIVQDDGEGFSEEEFLQPVYKATNTYIYNAKYITAALGGALLLIFGFAFKDKIFSFSRRDPDLFSDVYKEGVNYSRLHHLISKLGNGVDMKDTVQKSGLSEGSKKYLMDLINKVEAEYKRKGSSSAFRVPRKVMRDIVASVRRNELN